ncbi:MAG: GTPase HflX [Eubacteriales bacterium]|nr:GTPase HflX [Eubacteriales bacterium]
MTQYKPEQNKAEQNKLYTIWAEHRADEPARAVLVGVRLPEDSEFDEAMRELSALAQACDMKVEEILEQSLPSPTPAYYIGSGKVQEIQALSSMMHLDWVIFDNTLSPAQLKNLQKEIEVPILDRTGLILEIFARRAKTREARLQVESAHLQYMLPRLVGMRESLGRQAGASGSQSNKGSGEKQIELDRRRIEKRISELRRELDAIEHDRGVQRKRRSRSFLPQAALVGYTNAGKSTLMNALLSRSGNEQEEKQVVAQDMLFATLDTTVRRIRPGTGRDFLLSDTVGFVSRLPHDLIKAFRSTLDEVRFADLLLEVVDASDERSNTQMAVTQETLRELGADRIPRIQVMNKADRLFPEESLPRVQENRIYLSAKSGAGLSELLDMISELLYADRRTVRFLIPYPQGDVANALNESAEIHERDYLPEGVLLTATCSGALLGKYGKFIVPEETSH